MQTTAVPDCRVVNPALYGVLSVLPPQLTIRLPDGPAFAIASMSATAVRSSKLLFLKRNGAVQKTAEREEKWIRIN